MSTVMQFVYFKMLVFSEPNEKKVTRNIQIDLFGQNFH